MMQARNQTVHYAVAVYVGGEVKRTERHQQQEKRDEKSDDDQCYGGDFLQCFFHLRNLRMLILFYAACGSLNRLNYKIDKPVGYDYYLFDAFAVKKRGDFGIVQSRSFYFRFVRVGAYVDFASDFAVYLNCQLNALFLELALVAHGERRVENAEFFSDVFPQFFGYVRGERGKQSDKRRLAQSAITVPLAPPLSERRFMAFTSSIILATAVLKENLS